MKRVYELARYPLVQSDYRIVAEEGREIEHLLIDGIVFATGWTTDLEL